MTLEEEILEKLRRIELKLDQCIAMNNANHISCEEIRHEIRDMRIRPPENAKIEDTESRNVKLQRAREQKEMINAKISKTLAEIAQTNNAFFKEKNEEKRSELSSKIKTLENELNSLQEELEKILEYQQSAIKD